ncbi:hypothetical protein V6N13_122124 [Hibiscus sabdariffa]|uniref:Uncharacterized protein n=1 Tax=Hibiscus sabdariffa TaxID=183260 RepID=A0ABR2NQ21_9ROSI
MKLFLRSREGKCIGFVSKGDAHNNKIEAPSKGESSTVASNTLFVVPRAAKLCSRGQLVQFLDPASFASI